MDLKRKFESEEELEAKRKKRQEEWEKVRKPDDPEEAPEEEYDPRSLYDRLQEVKQRKQEEYEEQHQLKNQIRGLDENETEFLDFVSNRQMELDKEREKEEQQLLQEYKESMVTKTPATLKAGTSKLASTSKSEPARNTSKKSQAEILAGAIRRKETKAGTSEVPSEGKAASEGHLSKEAATSQAPAVDHTAPGEGNSTEARNDAGHMFLPSAVQVVGMLPGMKDYSDSSDEEGSSSSDLDEVPGFSKQTKFKISTPAGNLAVTGVSGAELRIIKKALQRPE